MCVCVCEGEVCTRGKSGGKVTHLLKLAHYSSLQVLAQKHTNKTFTLQMQHVNA